jgi:hypothetical protein
MHNRSGGSQEASSSTSPTEWKPGTQVRVVRMPAQRQDFPHNKTALRREGDRIASDFNHGRGTRSLRSEAVPKTGDGTRASLVRVSRHDFVRFSERHHSAFFAMSNFGTDLLLGSERSAPSRSASCPRGHSPLSHFANSTPPRWPGCDFQHRSLNLYRRCAVWQAQGEYLFGGTGTSIRQEYRFERM